MPNAETLSAVTFDCWNTLLYEPADVTSPTDREDLVMRTLLSHGVDAAEEHARDAFRSAAGRHWKSWRDGIATGAVEVIGWTLESLQVEDPELEQRLVQSLQRRALQNEVRALDGARETLERLAEAGIRRALICDTGFTPAAVVRELLDRVQLLELLELTVFSDEAGVPKPDPRVFQRALEHFDVAPQRSAHVGDLRRTDVVGARAMGMRSVRIRSIHDDTTELPEADLVADSHAHLQILLGL